MLRLKNGPPDKHDPDDGGDDQTDEQYRRLGKILVGNDAIDPLHLFDAMAIRRQRGGRLERTLLANDWVLPADLAKAQAQQWQADIIALDRNSVDRLLIDRIGAGFCLRHQVLPYWQKDGTTCIATSNPNEYSAIKNRLCAKFGDTTMLICTEAQLEAAITSYCAPVLARRAETSVPRPFSCRSFSRLRYLPASVLAFSLIILAMWHFPHIVLTALLLIIGIGLLSQACLRFLCLITALRIARRESRKSREDAAALALFDAKTIPLPPISVLVPLYREANIVPQLITNLSSLEYPRDLTDILLVVEAGDDTTHAALKTAELPKWMRIVEVPDGQVRTKPRALSYALNFCRGEIVGILDAEDRPDPDQLYQIARHFLLAPKDVGCLQGKLDYFNPRTNWLSRCFTIEYAAWFRVMLPAFAALGLAIPLGGTTCYFRRKALDDVGAWDAWNVTEDADLGVRLNRRGWKTEIIETTTDEEANCRATPWIRQRSRWLKGYAMTFGVHMRNPAQLWRDLGAKRFIGFQLQFCTMLTQFLTAPALWGFWVLGFGLHYPLEQPLYTLLGANGLVWIFVVCLTSETIGFAISLLAVRGEKHRHLCFWIPMMHFYFPLGSVAAWKAFYELFTHPFYWDKTAHGVFTETGQQPAAVNLRHYGTIGEKPVATRLYRRQVTPQRPLPANGKGASRTSRRQGIRRAG